MEESANWHAIFCALYVCDEKICYDEIIYKHGISETALRRFVEKSNLLAEALQNTDNAILLQQAD